MVQGTHQSFRHARNLRDRLAADSLPGGLLFGLDGFEEADALGDDGVEVSLVGSHGWGEERAGAVEDPRERRRRRAPGRGDGDGGGGGRTEELGRCRREPPTSPPVKKLGFRIQEEHAATDGPGFESLHSHYAFLPTSASLDVN